MSRRQHPREYTHSCWGFSAQGWELSTAQVPKPHCNIPFLFLKNINLREIRGCSSADVCRKVVKRSFKIRLVSRWDVRQHHWVGSNRNPCSVPGQQSFEWEFWLCHRLDAAVWWLQLQQGNQGKVLWEAFLMNLVCRGMFKLNASQPWPRSQHGRGKVAQALHSAPEEAHCSVWSYVFKHCWKKSWGNLDSAQSMKAHLTNEGCLALHTSALAGQFFVHSLSPLAVKLVECPLPMAAGLESDDL